MSSLKSMLPTDSFSIGNSRSLTGSTLTDANCASDKLTLGGSPEAPPAGRAGALCALAFDVCASSPDFCQFWDGPKKYPPAPISRAAAATAAPIFALVLAAMVET